MLKSLQDVRSKTSAICKMALAGCLLGAAMSAAQAADCNGLPSHSALETALKAVAPQSSVNGGLNTNMWATLVNRAGVVCAVAKTGNDPGDQWPGSRAISAQKANTANAFSLDSANIVNINGLALSTANLFSAVQPGGSLYGLQHSNPVDTDVAYGGNADNYGQVNDFMVSKKIGGVNVFGGGLALYDSSGTLLGALGVSGDTSCGDHNIAWRTRDHLGLDYVPAGVNPTTGDDNIIFDIIAGSSVSGFGHPTCGFGADAKNPAIVAACPTGDGSTPGC